MTAVKVKFSPPVVCQAGHSLTAFENKRYPFFLLLRFRFYEKSCDCPINVHEAQGRTSVQIPAERVKRKCGEQKKTPVMMLPECQAPCAEGLKFRVCHPLRVNYYRQPGSYYILGGNSFSQIAFSGSLALEAKGGSPEIESDFRLAEPLDYF